MVAIVLVSLKWGMYSIIVSVVHSGTPCCQRERERVRVRESERAREQEIDLASDHPILYVRYI